MVDTPRSEGGGGVYGLMFIILCQQQMQKMQQEPNTLATEESLPTVVL